MAVPFRPFLNTKEVADMFRVSVETIHMQRHRGQEPGALGFKAGKRVLFRPEDIEAWIDAQIGKSGE